MNKSELAYAVRVYENALNIIAHAFMLPDELLELGDNLSDYERLEMAYDNIQYEAQNALNKVKALDGN